MTASAVEAEKNHWIRFWKEGPRIFADYRKSKKNMRFLWGRRMMIPVVARHMICWRQERKNNECNAEGGRRGVHACVRASASCNTSLVITFREGSGSGSDGMMVNRVSIGFGKNIMALSIPIFVLRLFPWPFWAMEGVKVISRHQILMNFYRQI